MSVPTNRTANLTAFLDTIKRVIKIDHMRTLLIIPLPHFMEIHPSTLY